VTVFSSFFLFSYPRKTVGSLQFLQQFLGIHESYLIQQNQLVFQYYTQQQHMNLFPRNNTRDSYPPTASAAAAAAAMRPAYFGFSNRIPGATPTSALTQPGVGITGFPGTMPIPSSAIPVFPAAYGSRIAPPNAIPAAVSQPAYRTSFPPYGIPPPSSSSSSNNDTTAMMMTATASSSQFPRYIPYAADYNKRQKRVVSNNGSSGIEGNTSNNSMESANSGVTSASASSGASVVSLGSPTNSPYETYVTIIIGKYFKLPKDDNKDSYLGLPAFSTFFPPTRLVRSLFS
jgi:hypothetical protein